MERVRDIRLPRCLRDHFGRQDPTWIRGAEPFEVSSFSQLVSLSAEVACLNPSMFVLYRGQRHEWVNGDKTMLMPSIYRWDHGSAMAPGPVAMQSRLNTLNRTSLELVRFAESLLGSGATKDELSFDQLVKRESLKWAVLQHYGYCATPYLDATQSLRMACMFALDGASEGDAPCVYVLGFPYPYDRHFRDSVSEVTIVRLLSAMPPAAKRAYFQEGYLVGSEIDLRRYTPRHDVAQRLLAKFSLVGDKRGWIEQLSTFERSDVYSEDVFSRMRGGVLDRVIEEGGVTVDAPNAEQWQGLENPDKFPSLVRG